MEETIELIVKVKINYSQKNERKEAIKQASKGVLSTRTFGTVGYIPKSAKLYKPKTEKRAA